MRPISAPRCLGSDGVQRLGGRLEQDLVDRRLVLEGDRGDLGRQREHHVEVGNRKKLILPRGEPVPAGLPLALWAVPGAAGNLGHADYPAGPATLDMAAQLCGPAQLDGAHRAALDAPKMAVMGTPIRLAMAAEDIRHLQSRRHGGTGQSGGTTSMFSRSSGLVVRRISPFETFV